MSNPFTRSIAVALHERRLREFITHWDVIEALVVRVYRGDAATTADEVEYAAVRPHALATHTQLRTALEPHWRTAKVAGVLATEDPFVVMLRHEAAADFLGDWPAMQALPAAREALNKLVLEVQK
ncbi:MAG: hypothetical protein NTZ50_01295 [Chloroflexi bacterium]|nr:hypothetical protein [Chloroflexota bacterium]